LDLFKTIDFPFGVSLPKADSQRRVVFYTANPAQPTLEVEAAFDAYSRRIVPGIEGARSKHILLLGGLDQVVSPLLKANQTIGAFISQLDPNFNSYGISGPNAISAADFLLLFKKTKWNEGILEPSGAAVFVFNYAQLLKIARAASFLKIRIGPNAPAVALNSFGRPEFLGLAKDAFPYYFYFVNVLIKSSLWLWFNQQFPFYMDDQILDLYAKMIVEIAQAYWQKYPNNAFYFMIHPNTPEGGIEIAQRLKPHGITILNYGALPVRTLLKDKALLQDDSTSPWTNALLASWMVEDVKVSP
jgi:hypothetical protein